MPKPAKIAMIVDQKRTKTTQQQQNFKKQKNHKINEIKQICPYINGEIFKSYETTSHFIVKILIKKK